jgi:hypothetical protein
MSSQKVGQPLRTRCATHSARTVIQCPPNLLRRSLAFQEKKEEHLRTFHQLRVPPVVLFPVDHLLKLDAPPLLHPITSILNPVHWQDFLRLLTPQTDINFWRPTSFNTRSSRTGRYSFGVDQFYCLYMLIGSEHSKINYFEWFIVNADFAHTQRRDVNGASKVLKLRSSEKSY